MTKAITTSENYEFRLSDELKVMAETELRETCATRDFALQALRDWIDANPRIAASRMGKLKIISLFFSLPVDVMFLCMKILFYFS